MTWRRLAPGAALLALAIGCGDDGPPSEPVATTLGATGMTAGSGGSTPAGTTAGSSTPPGSTMTAPGPGSSGSTASVDPDTGQDSTGPVGVPCDYPEGAVEPMTLGEVLAPYSWPTAIAADGTRVALDLADAPCGIDDVIEWSPHDVLLFVSIPAW